MKLVIILLGIGFALPFTRLAATPEKLGVEQLIGLIAIGKECEKDFSGNPLVFKMKLSRVGDMSVWASKESDLEINKLHITNNAIELLSLHHDTMGCYPLQLVPALPKLDDLIKIDSEGEIFKALGIPYGGAQNGNFANWGFFCVSQNELRILTVRIRVDRSGGNRKLLAIELQTGAILVPRDDP